MARSSLLLCIPLLLLIASYSSAEVGSCKDDIKKFCQGVKAGQGRVKKCLTEHEAELSDTCLKQRNSRKKVKFSECAEDIKKYCSDIKKGKGRIKACLRQKNKDDLSGTCQKALGV